MFEPDLISFLLLAILDEENDDEHGYGEPDNDADCDEAALGRVIVLVRRDENLIAGTGCNLLFAVMVVALVIIMIVFSFTLLNSSFRRTSFLLLCCFFLCWVLCVLNGASCAWLTVHI